MATTHACSKCGEVKAKTEFYKDKHSSLGHRSDCKVCNNKKSLEYRVKHPGRRLETDRKRRQANPEKYAAIDRAYRLTNREAYNIRKRAQRKRRREQDALYNFKCTLRDLVKKSLRNGGWSKDTKSDKIIGCSFEDLQAHLIATALDNYGYWSLYDEYHIDHIQPMSSAKTNEEAIALNHWTNFQYLTPTDNLKKGGSF